MLGKTLGQKTVGFVLPGRPFDARSELCQLAPCPLSHLSIEVYVTILTTSAQG